MANNSLSLFGALFECCFSKAKDIEMSWPSFRIKVFVLAPSEWIHCSNPTRCVRAWNAYLLGYVYFLCARHRGMFVHITANFIWLLGSSVDIWLVFTPLAPIEFGILKSVLHLQDDHAWPCCFHCLYLLALWGVFVCVCLYVQQGAPWVGG